PLELCPLALCEIHRGRSAIGANPQMLITIGALAWFGAGPSSETPSRAQDCSLDVCSLSPTSRNRRHMVDVLLGPRMQRDDRRRNGMKVRTLLSIAAFASALAGPGFAFAQEEHMISGKAVPADQVVEVQA